MILTKSILSAGGAPNFVFFGPFLGGQRVLSIRYSSPATTSTQFDLSAVRLSSQPQSLADIAGGDPLLTGSLSQTGGIPCIRPTAQVYHSFPIDFLADGVYSWLGVQSGEAGTVDTVSIEVQEAPLPPVAKPRKPKVIRRPSAAKAANPYR